MEIRGRVGPGRAEQVAAAVRAAFAAEAGAGRLPPPDGAAETAADVVAAVRAGARLWLAVAGGDAVLGSVRAVPHPAGWELRRLAVRPGARGTGVARALVRALEAAAAADGVPEVTLDSVVERGNPPVYARLGYRTVAHLPGPVLPLSEVTQRRCPAAVPLVRTYPWHAGDEIPTSAAAVGWFAVPGGTVAVPGALPGDAAVHTVRSWAARCGAAGRVELIGVDTRPRGGPEHLGRRVAALREQGGRVDGGVDGGVVRFDRAAHDVPSFVMPRVGSPDWLAVVRTIV